MGASTCAWRVWTDLQPLLGKHPRLRLRPTSSSPGTGGARTRLDLVASNIVAAGVSGNAHLSAAGPVSNLRIELAAQSPDIHGTPANFSAGAQLDEAKRVLDLDRFEAHYHGQTLHLVSPSRVMFAKRHQGEQSAACRAEGGGRR